MEVNELFKQRSITACMKASYNTVTSDIRSLVKQTWVTHVPFAVLLAIVLYFLLPNKSLHDWGEANPMASFILQTIIYAATLVMAAVSFWHLLPHKQLCPQGEKRKPGKSLVRILRHFGGFLMTCFLGMMIVGIATFIAAVPTIILIIAQLYSQLGALQGDPLGVPGYFTPLLFLVFTLTSLLIIYALTWLGIALAYQYASYKVQDEEKKKLKENQQQMAVAGIEQRQIFFVNNSASGTINKSYTVFHFSNCIFVNQTDSFLCFWNMNRNKITNTPNKPSEIWIVVEKGAAKRFLGVPTERKRSLLLKVNWDLRVIYHFKKDDFHPKPSVDSVLLHLSKKDNSDLDNNELVPFEKFIDHSLKYGLLSNKSLLTRKQVRTALKLENLPPLEKNQMPTYSQWICLFKCYQKFR